MNYKTGQAKPMEEITLDDALEYPIWQWALSGETIPGQDGTWQEPIISTNNVTKEMGQPIITLKTADGRYYASAEYKVKADVIEAVSIWYDGEWFGLEDMEIFDFPLTFVAIPTIGGISNAKFEWQEWTARSAKRIA